MIKYDRNFITFITQETVVYSMERNFYTNKSTETLIRRRHLHLRIIVTCIGKGKGGFLRFITYHNSS